MLIPYVVIPRFKAGIINENGIMAIRNSRFKE
jgi:hypothetical protein